MSLLLRARRSAPSSLREAFQTSNHPPPVPTLRPQHSRTFVSQVLVSRKPFEVKTVTELKADLREQGLSTYGKKSELIARAYDAARMAASRPLSDMPNSAVARPRNHFRSASATATSKPSPSGPPPPMPSSSSRSATQQLHPNLKLRPFEAPETKPAYPGLPSTIVLPAGEVEPPLPEAPIPLIDSSSKSSSVGVPFTLSPRRVITASPEEVTARTHSSGAQSLHPLPSAVDTLLTEEDRGPGQPRTREEMARDAEYAKSSTEGIAEVVKGFVKDVRATVPIPAEFNLGGSSSSSDSGSESEGKPEEFKFVHRDLNGGERTGLMVLGGLLGVGWLMGGLGKKSKAKADEKH